MAPRRNPNKPAKPKTPPIKKKGNDAGGNSAAVDKMMAPLMIKAHPSITNEAKNISIFFI